ncbi:hypothetical protein VNO78_11215 [Psophocarpus tetragonolobus]|uniref:Uncharacterized protein n=1 Tax=Psophocarpus tetragonolobus TaxID=3891 RepID=A0AAN9SLC9_PSOTE
MVRSAIILLTSCVFVGRRGFQGPTNLVIGSTAADDDSSKEWLALDHKVFSFLSFSTAFLFYLLLIHLFPPQLNSYPTLRGFTAIGTCGQDFVQAMLLAVESLIQQSIPQLYSYTIKHAVNEYVKQKLSSEGKYVSVNIGPIQVVSSEQNATIGSTASLASSSHISLSSVLLENS